MNVRAEKLIFTTEGHVLPLLPRFHAPPPPPDELVDEGPFPCCRAGIKSILLNLPPAPLYVLFTRIILFQMPSFNRKTLLCPCSGADLPMGAAQAGAPPAFEPSPPSPCDLATWPNWLPSFPCPCPDKENHSPDAICSASGKLWGLISPFRLP